MIEDMEDAVGLAIDYVRFSGGATGQQRRTIIDERQRSWEVVRDGYLDRVGVPRGRRRIPVDTVEEVRNSNRGPVRMQVRSSTRCVVSASLPEI